MVSLIWYNLQAILSSRQVGMDFFAVDMTSPITFIQQTYTELKQVVWPTKEGIIKLTIIVVLISVVVGIYIGVLDFLLTKLTELLLK